MGRGVCRVRTFILRVCVYKRGLDGSGRLMEMRRPGGATRDTTVQKPGRKHFRKQCSAGASLEGCEPSEGCWYLDLCDLTELCSVMQWGQNRGGLRGKREEVKGPQ